jgi:hypothetical protein
MREREDFDVPFADLLSSGKTHSVIPGRALREPGIHSHRRGYGFRACAKRRIPE